jgi:hypothetical protein
LTRWSFWDNSGYCHRTKRAAQHGDRRYCYWPRWTGCRGWPGTWRGVAARTAAAGGASSPTPFAASGRTRGAAAVPTVRWTVRQARRKAGWAVRVIHDERANGRGHAGTAQRYETTSQLD